MAHIITTTLAENLYVNGYSASSIQTSLGVSLLAGSFTLDFSMGNNFTISLQPVSILAAPINATAGQSGIIFLTQDVNGSNLMSFNAVWRFSNGNAPTLSVTAGSVDALAYVVRAGGLVPIISCQLIQSI